MPKGASRFAAAVTKEIKRPKIRAASHNPCKLQQIIISPALNNFSSLEIVLKAGESSDTS